MTSVSSSTEFHHQHHFKSAEHQYSSAKQGIWLFLCTEILMFGGLFVGYLIYHSFYPTVFKNGSLTLDWKMGAVNTVVLLISSFTMAAAINYIQRGFHKIASVMLALTIACAIAFMVIKYFEYTHKFHVGTVPGKFSLVDPTCGVGGNRAECESKIAALLKNQQSWKKTMFLLKK